MSYGYSNLYSKIKGYDYKNQINETFISIIRSEIKDRRALFSILQDALGENNYQIIFEIIHTSVLKEEYTFISKDELEKMVEFKPELFRYRPIREFRKKDFNAVSNLIHERVSKKALGQYFWRNGVVGLNSLFIISKLFDRDLRKINQVLDSNICLDIPKNMRQKRNVEKFQKLKEYVSFNSILNILNGGFTTQCLSEFNKLILEAEELHQGKVPKKYILKKPDFLWDICNKLKAHIEEEKLILKKTPYPNNLSHIIGSKVDGYQVSIIEDSRELALCARKQKNCLIDYHKNLLDGEVIILKLEKDDLLFCAEFRKKGRTSLYRLVQIKGVCNSRELEIENKKLIEFRKRLIGLVNPNAKDHESLDISCIYMDQGWGRTERLNFAEIMRRRDNQQRELALEAPIENYLDANQVSTGIRDILTQLDETTLEIDDIPF